MDKEAARALAAEVRSLPPSMLDARLLAKYVSTGEAYDLSELCRKSDTAVKQVAQIVVTSGLDALDKLPGYTMTSEIFELAENIYSIGKSRRPWQFMRNRHKPEYLETYIPREDLKILELNPVESKRHYASVYFRAWAIFWDDEFISRMINKVDSRLIANLPEELITEKICLTAVAKTGLSLRYVPPALRSPVVCARAVQSDPLAINFTPAHLRDQVRKLIKI